MKLIVSGSLLVPLVLLSMAAPAFSQGRFVGAGSTPQGDYLRGLGIELWGEGLYNLNTAQGYSITVDANIRLDSYLSTVFRADRDNYQKLNKERMENTIKRYEQIQDRIRDHPEHNDVYLGTALNAAFDQLNDPAISPSSLRTAKVSIPREAIRRIPFKLDQKNLIFSLQRLTARGKGKWPVAFQQDNYAADIRAYLRAIDHAMDQMIDGKIENQTIDEYKQVIAAMSLKLDSEYENRTSDVRYREARKRLREMEKATELMKAQKAQSILAEIDRYNGNTVEDLRKFMDEHHLKFAEVNDESADERNLYVELYAAIDEMRSIVVGKTGGKDR